MSYEVNYSESARKDDVNLNISISPVAAVLHEPRNCPAASVFRTYSLSEINFDSQAGNHGRADTFPAGSEDRRLIPTRVDKL